MLNLQISIIGTSEKHLLELLEVIKKKIKKGEDSLTNMEKAEDEGGYQFVINSH